MSTVLDPIARRRVEGIRADLVRTMTDIDTLTTGDTSTIEAARTRLRDAIGSLDVLADEAVVRAWISCVGPFWALGTVPWTSMADVFTAVTGNKLTRDGLDRQFTTLFAHHAPRRQTVPARNVAGGYSATALWAATTHWHLNVGLPLPVSAWRSYGDVAAVLDLLPAIVEHRDVATTRKQLVAAVRATGGRVSKMYELHVAELAREHVDAARHWVAGVAGN